MNYELAKELKDAGFPQGGVNRERGFNIDTGEPIMYPRLSELIEACGEPFYSLHAADGWDGKEWFASLNHDSRKLIASNAKCSGKTPEEAVARLWLALNKK